MTGTLFVDFDSLAASCTVLVLLEDVLQMKAGFFGEVTILSLLNISTTSDIVGLSIAFFPEHIGAQSLCISKLHRDSMTL